MTDLECAEKLREEIHREALIKARALYPEIGGIVDEYGAEDYFQEQWDYPGAWYRVVAIPSGFKSREKFVDELVKNTVENYLRARDAAAPEEPFYALLAKYPDCAVDFCLVQTDGIYKGGESHFEALMKGAAQIMGGGLNYNIGTIKAKPIATEDLFAPAKTRGELNYRGAFLNPPHTNSYTDADFDKINSALFPKGTGGLEAFEWTTDWSDYFDEGHEWWGTLCITVYDKSLNRFAVILASATD